MSPAVLETGTLPSRPDPAGMDRAPQPPAPVVFHYTQTDSFVALLRQLGASLVVSYTKRAACQTIIER